MSTRVASEVTIEVEGPQLRGFPRRGTGHSVCFCGVKRSAPCGSCGWYPPAMTARKAAAYEGLTIEEVPWVRTGSLPAKWPPRRGTAREVLDYIKKREREKGFGG